MTLRREEWQGIVRDVDWTLGYVDDEAVYPDWLSGTGKVPREAWSKWEESYKVAYPEYVRTQDEKETSAYAVKAALNRSNQYDNLTEAWRSSVKMHLGGIALVEYAAVYGESRMARFGLSPAWRNMAVMGTLDEIRHGQLSLSFAHELVERDPQFDWAHKALHTNDWVSIALRALIDNMMIGGSVVDIAIQLPFAFETGFTNIQFVALAADALEAGDVAFANLISSIQTDEARHSQQGGPTLEVLVEHDPVRAQWTVDKFFWLSARAFSALTGPSMDYNTPVEHRKQSYKEFMEEWIIDQFVRTIQDYGLKRPWYWDEFIAGLDVWHHSLQMGEWFWRPTLWWKPVGVDAESREWLIEKYPNWELLYGDKWRVMAENIAAGNMHRALPETLPWLCNYCHLPTCNATYGYDGKWRVRNHSLVHNGVRYHFCTRTCRQIWWEDRDALNNKTVVERFLAGDIQPMDVPGILGYMGLTPDVFGDDAGGYDWVESYAATVPAGAGVGS